MSEQNNLSQESIKYLTKRLGRPPTEEEIRSLRATILSLFKFSRKLEKDEKNK
jgi:hypothetical protein